MNQTVFTTLTENELRAIVKESIKEEMAFYFSAEKSNRPAYDMLTMKELSDQLKISKPTIIKWTREGRLKAHKIGRRVFYKKEDVDKSLKEYQGSVGSEMRMMQAFKNWQRS